MTSDCSLCVAKPDDEAAVRAHMDVLPDRVTVCEDHKALLLSLGYRFGRANAERPSRHVRRAAKRVNLTRAQRKAAT